MRIRGTNDKKEKVTFDTRVRIRQLIFPSKRRWKFAKRKVRNNASELIVLGEFCCREAAAVSLTTDKTIVSCFLLALIFSSFIRDRTKLWNRWDSRLRKIAREKIIKMTEGARLMIVDGPTLRMILELIHLRLIKFIDIHFLVPLMSLFEKNTSRE